MATAQATATNATETARGHAQRADQATAELKTLTIENAKLIGKSDILADQLTKAEARATAQANKIEALTAQVAKLEQIEKENADKSRKNQKPQNNDN